MGIYMRLKHCIPTLLLDFRGKTRTLLEVVAKMLAVSTQLVAIKPLGVETPRWQNGCGFYTHTHTHTLTMGFQLHQSPRNEDANGKAAGSVQVKLFNKKVCATAGSSC